MFLEIAVSKWIEVIKNMTCKKIKNQLLLFLDNELPEAQQKEIQHHLAACPDCLKHLKQLTNIWECPTAIETIVPSARLWNRIIVKLSASKNRPGLLSDFRELIVGHAVPISATAIILIGILTGTFLGSLPNDPNPGISGTQPVIAAKADFIKTSHLDAFDDLPPASIGGVYLSLETNK